MAVRKWLNMFHSRGVPAKRGTAFDRRGKKWRWGAIGDPGARRCCFEPLEERTLLSVTLTSNRLQLILNDAGKVTGVYECVGGVRTGSNLFAGTTPSFAAEYFSGVPTYATSCSYNGTTGNLTFGFPSSGSMTVHVTQGTANDYMTFTVTALGNSPEMIYLGGIQTTLATIDNVSGMATNADFAMYIRSLNAATSQAYAGPFYVLNDLPAHLVGGTSFALGGCDYGTDGSGVRASLATLIAETGLLTSSAGGPSALDAPVNRESYILALDDLTYQNYTDYIALAKSAGVEMIVISGWETTNGTNAVNLTAFPGGLAAEAGDYTYAHSLAYVCDEIHDAGLHVGFHHLTGYIDTNDVYVISGNTGLAHDCNTTLKTTVTSTTTSIVVQGAIAAGVLSTGGGVGCTLQIGNELMTYTGYSYNSGTNATAFTGVTRGAFGTTKAVHAAGANVGHLFTAVGVFFADPDSSLATNMAASLSNVVNVCNAEMVYLDGAENGLNLYAKGKMAYDIVAGFDHAVRVEQSSVLAYTWTFASVIMSWSGDYPIYGVNDWVDAHVGNINRNRLLPSQLGWFYLAISGVNGQGTLANYSITSREFEYFVVKAIANDMPMSLEYTLSASQHGEQDEFLSILKSWKTIASDLSEATKAELAILGDEFHLQTLSDGSVVIQRVNNAQHTASAAVARTSTWTVNNSYDAQNPTITIQALSGIGSYTGTSTTLTGNESDVSATSVTANAGITGAAVSWAGSPNGSLPYAGYTNGNSFLEFTAHNTSASRTSSWVEASRVYSSALSIGTKGAIGVWIYGDGKGEILDLQLFNGAKADPYAISDHCVTVDFMGWKYFEFQLADRSLQQYNTHWWPRGAIDWATTRQILEPTQIGGINILYNNIPVGQTVTCSIALVKALPITNITLTNPSVTTNGATITFPIALASGQYLQFNSMTDCSYYDINGNLLGSIVPTGTLVTLANGANTVAFSGGARARVTVATYDAQSSYEVPAIDGNWRFEELSGTTIIDSSSYHNHGTISASVTRVTGVSGNALQLNGADAYATIPSSNSLDAFTTHSFVVGLSFKVSGAGPSGKAFWTLLSKNSTGYGTKDPFQIGILSGNFHLWVRVGSGDEELNMDSGVAVNDGRFHDVSLVYDNATLTYTLYLDGNVVAMQAMSPDWRPANNYAPITLGCWPPYGNFFNGVIDEVRIYGDYALANPMVENVDINAGAAQRSMVESLVVTFSDIVSIAAGAFEVRNRATGQLVALAAATQTIGGKTIATLTFSGNQTDYKSLKDGEYQLTIAGDRIRNSVTMVALDGDGDGQCGGNHVFGAAVTDKFFRKFGDSDGDRDVDGLDLLAFRKAYLGVSSNLCFDFDGDGDVDTVDLLRFRQRYA